MESLEKIIELEKPGVIKEYAPMIKHIQDNLPSTLVDSENFYKSSSQFKNAVLDVTDLTPISSLRHVLAVITQTRQAIEAAEIGLKRKYLEKEIKQEKLKITSLDTEYRSLLIDLQEIDYLIQDTEQSLRGAIRRLSFMISLYKNILEELGIEHLTEEEFEKNEIKHHIMTAFLQALNAARSRGGVIDEGNHIYLFQLGINNGVAQSEVLTFLSREEQIFASGGTPTHDMIMDWLHDCAEKYSDDVEKFVKKRSLIMIDNKSLVNVLELNK